MKKKKLKKIFRKMNNQLSEYVVTGIATFLCYEALGFFARRYPYIRHLMNDGLDELQEKLKLSQKKINSYE